MYISTTYLIYFFIDNRQSFIGTNAFTINGNDWMDKHGSKIQTIYMCEYKIKGIMKIYCNRLVLACFTNSLISGHF